MKDSPVDFILSHLEKPLFSRNIMTKQLGCQVEVFDKEAMLQYFEESHWLDCRINAYPRLTYYNGIQLVGPSLVVIDLDLSNLTSIIALDAVLKATLKRIYNLLKVNPTVLWTGNGYHIYLPINAFVLEEEEVFARFAKNGCNLGTKFMRFAEEFFTNKRQDPQHRPSVNSCLLRVPGSYNSKNGQQVRIIQEWDGHRPAIQYMLRDFRRYLIQEQIDQINTQEKKPSTNIGGQPSSIGWIEHLLQTPRADHRKYCMWRIMTPYLVNVRKLSDEEALSAVMAWLDKCTEIARLSFNPRQRARYDIRNARRKGYYPISLNNLQTENADLYDLLMEGEGA